MTWAAQGDRVSGEVDYTERALYLCLRPQVPLGNQGVRFNGVYKRTDVT